MMSDTTPDKASGRPAFQNPVLATLASLKFALVVVALIALACIAGTVIPQGSQVGAYLEQHPGATRVMDVLSLLGLTRVFYAWWFVILLFILAASLAACTYRRYLAIGRSHGALRARVIGSFIAHVSLLLVIGGGVMRVLWGQKGTLQMHEGDTAGQVISPDGAFPLPFSIRLVKFDLEFDEPKPALTDDSTGRLMMQWADKQVQETYPTVIGVPHPVAAPEAPKDAAPAFTVTVLRYVPDFMIEGSNGQVQSRSPSPNNPALQVEVSGNGATNTQWVFARFPDFSNHGADAGAAPQPLAFRFVMGGEAAPTDGGPSIKAFKSTVEILENNAVVRRQTLAVNSPFTYRGYAFYQLSYNPQDLTWSALQVVKDPGVPVVYAGFVLMMVGLTIVFCVGPWLDEQRRTTGGTP